MGEQLKRPKYMQDFLDNPPESFTDSWGVAWVRVPCPQCAEMRCVCPEILEREAAQERAGEVKDG